MKPFTENQNIEIDGVELGLKPERKHSRFYNKGKWDNFILPILPRDCSTFVEIGCNAGVFLAEAKRRGFRDVIGVEKSLVNCSYARKYRDSLRLDYKILNRAVGRDFDFDALPVADVTLLSNTHYYLRIDEWLAFLDRLQYKTRYCLVVSRHDKKDKHWMASGALADVRHYFRGWEEVGGIDDVSQEGDPSPRPLWSMLFKSGLGKVELKYLYSINERVGGLVSDRVDKKLMADIEKNGLREPLLIKPSGQLLDGRSRLNVLMALGRKRAVVRLV